MLSPLVGYAATALGHIAISGGTPLQVREIAAATGVPAPYLSKIVNQLSRKGFVVTRRGTGGGVQLSVDPDAVTLLELCEALEDPILSPQCMLGLGACDDDVACPAHEFSREIRERQMEFLRETTLHDVGRFHARGLARGAMSRSAFTRSANQTRKHAPAPRTKRRKGAGG
ncbi:MAG: Rrf2 family transcriptional regulator [Planctomycetes bacterium]|nr:Rrf2 family transcriptional regulator [Planctomycetota bacterium]